MVDCITVLKECRENDRPKTDEVTQSKNNENFFLLIR